MDYKIVSSDEINVIGIQTRTNNSDARKDIPELWQEFYKDNLPARIPDRIDNDVIAVYTDYEGDHTKPYTLIIGCKVVSIYDVPEGMVSKKIPSAKYAVFEVAGESPQNIINVWQYVWTSDLKRSYESDFELYKNASPVKAEVYIGIN